MLIEFTVENFRSINEPVTLSMVAAPRLGKRQNVVPAGIEDEKGFPALLKVAAIYGPNASGKSTLVQALWIFRDLLNREQKAEKRALPVSSFRFDKTKSGRPSRFEIHFVNDGSRYAYELALDADRIHLEKLSKYKRGKAQVLFCRELVDGREAYLFGADLEGGAALAEIWKNLTGPQSLFLGRAVANSSEELSQLRGPWRWLKHMHALNNETMTAMAQVTKQLIVRSSEFSEFVSDFLSDVDLPISSIKVESLDPIETMVELAGIVADEEKAGARVRALRSEPLRTTLTHRTTLGDADFDFSEESSGTQNLIGFATPWFVFGSDGATSDVCVVDELDGSLHPKIVADLVRRHIERGNPNQLIFTTHDTHLMDAKLLRRDEFWFTERDETGATQLRCLHDFEGREGEDIEKRYYEGRYRALPFIRKE